MKYQQVSVDFVNMVFTACTYLALAGAAWILLRLLQACFWLPRHLKQQNSMQKMLQEKVDGYEKYILECEEKERAAAEQKENDDDKIEESEDTEKTAPVPIDEKKWKERRECLEMLKKELKRVSDGGDPYDWDHLLEEEEEEEAEKEAENKEKQDDEKSASENEKDKDTTVKSEKEIENEQIDNATVDDSETKKDK